MTFGPGITIGTEEPKTCHCNHPVVFFKVEKVKRNEKIVVPGFTVDKSPDLTDDLN